MKVFPHKAFQEFVTMDYDRLTRIVPNFSMFRRKEFEGSLKMEFRPNGRSAQGGVIVP